MGSSINSSNENFETWMHQNFVSGMVKDSISNASILIVPNVQFRGIEQPLFPTGTTEFLEFLKSQLSGEHIEICVDDDKFQELALHSDFKRLGNFVVKEAVLPLFIGCHICPKRLE